MVQLTSQNSFIDVELTVLMSMRSTMWPPDNVDLAMDMSWENGTFWWYSVGNVTRLERWLGGERPCEFSARTKNKYDWPGLRNACVKWVE